MKTPCLSYYNHAMQTAKIFSWGNDTQLANIHTCYNIECIGYMWCGSVRQMSNDLEVMSQRIVSHDMYKEYS